MISLTPNDMVLLSEIVDAGSLAEAARRQGMTRANLSLRVRQIEERLGVQLFRRNTHTLVPTDLGERLSRHGTLIKSVMSDATSMLADEADVLVGSLHVCVPTGYGHEVLKHCLFEFCELYPKVNRAGFAGG